MQPVISIHPMLTLYNVISQDGYIARPDGSEDFIPDELWKDFLELCRKYGAVIVGRKTYEAIQKYERTLLDPFERLAVKRIVVTHKPDFQTKQGYVVVHSPEEAVALVPDALVSSGPALNNELLKKGLARNVLLHKIPLSIGSGIAPFYPALLGSASVTYLDSTSK